MLGFKLEDEGGMPANKRTTVVFVAVGAVALVAASVISAPVVVPAIVVGVATAAVEAVGFVGSKIVKGIKGGGDKSVDKSNSKSETISYYKSLDKEKSINSPDKKPPSKLVKYIKNKFKSNKNKKEGMVVGSPTLVSTTANLSNIHTGKPQSQKEGKYR